MIRASSLCARALCQIGQRHARRPRHKVLAAAVVAAAAETWLPFRAFRRLTRPRKTSSASKALRRTSPTEGSSLCTPALWSATVRQPWSASPAGGEQAAEAAVLNRLASQPPHPHIVWVRCRHDVGDLTYAVSARLHVDLFDEVIGVLPGVLPEATARAHFTQILSGLRHMHRLGVAHRDIKLENIMISQQGVVRLLDFGLSAVVPAQPPGPVFVNTQGNGQRGSQSYMAPEVFASGPGGPSYNIYAAEVWSLGCVLFAMSPASSSSTAQRATTRGSGAQRAQQNGLSTVGAMYNMYARQSPRRQPRRPARRNASHQPRRAHDARRRLQFALGLRGGRSRLAHDTVVPLAPALWRLRTQLRWARLRRPTQLANAFLRALVDQAEIRADLRPGGPGMRAAQAEFEETAPVYDSLPDRFPEAASPCYRSLGGSEARVPCTGAARS